MSGDAGKVLPDRRATGPEAEAARRAAAASQLRLRVRYRKDGRLAYLGHLEVLATVNRSVRRSGLPFAVGNGYTRRIRLQFSQALPVGAASEAEWFDLMLTRRVGEEEALQALRSGFPPALAPVAVGYVPRSLPAPEAWLTRSDWRVSFAREVGGEALGAAIARVRDQGQIDYLRGDRPKRVDVGQTLVGWQVGEDGRGMTLATHATSQASLRPAVLLAATGLDLPPYRVTRRAQWHEAKGGTLVAPLDVAERVATA